MKKQCQREALTAADIEDVGLLDWQLTMALESLADSAKDFIVSSRELAIFSVVAEQFQVG
jgi:hypothetical protein